MTVEDLARNVGVDLPLPETDLRRHVRAEFISEPVGAEDAAAGRGNRRLERLLDKPGMRDAVAVRREAMRDADRAEAAADTARAAADAAAVLAAQVGLSPHDGRCPVDLIDVHARAFCEHGRRVTGPDDVV